MNAVVLAGGVRSGLEIPGSGLPRALWPFPTEPLISQVLRFLAKGGCAGMAICANGKTKMMAAELSSGATPWMGLHYSEDPLPRGPAGCLRDLQQWVGSETMVVIQGTGWYDFDLGAMVEEHRKHRAAITVGARECGDGSGLLEPAGVYLMEPETLEMIPAVGYQDIKEQFIPKLIAGGMTVRCHKIVGQAVLIHSPEHYLAAMGDAIVRAGGAKVHETARVEAGAKISGMVWVDEGAIIEDGAVLVGPVVVGPGAKVERGAMVRKSVVMRNATIGAGAEIYSRIVPPNWVCAGVASRRIGVRKVDAGERSWKRWGLGGVGAGMMHAKA